jgi:site-specific DNA-methyltransferase (adenine-specific)
MELNKIYNEDCRETMKRIPDGSIDLMITDPPYNTTQCKWEYEIDLIYLWAEWKRILKPTGVLCIFADEPFTSKLITSNIDWFKIRITWDKMIGSGFLNAKIMPLKQTEDIVILSGANGGQYTYNPILSTKPKHNIRPLGNRKPSVNNTTYGQNNGQYSDDYDPEMNYPTNLLSVNSKQSECNSINRIHPTQKPVNLFRYLIKTYSNEGDTVFDGYVGSGTTAEACIEEKRNFIVSENNKEYFDFAQKRIINKRSELKLF